MNNRIKMSQSILARWDTSQVTDMRGMFLESSFQGDIFQWDVSRVTVMR